MPYQLKAKNVFLTYAQTPEGWTKESLLAALSLLPSGVPAGYCIAQESHADGGRHFHALLQFSEPVRTKDARFFDISDIHPNVQGARDPKATATYIQKDGDFIEFGLSVGAKRTWGDLVEGCTSRDEFMLEVSKSFPRDSVLSLEKLEYYAAKKFKPATPPYSPQYTDFTVPETLQAWKDENLFVDKDRPRSLFLVGASRLGGKKGVGH